MLIKHTIQNLIFYRTGLLEFDESERNKIDVPLYH